MPAPKSAAPPSRTVVLKLSSTVLRRFPHESPPVDDEPDIKIQDASSPPSSTSGEVGLQASSFDAASDAASTPAAAPASSDVKAKKGSPSTSAAAAAAATSNGAGNATGNGSGDGNGTGTPRGTKRALDKTSDNIGATKPARSRPSAAKKRLKLDDKTIDTSRLMPPGHKLGPKANQGAINAGLRALDRSGAPCRKWERKSFQLKSFTGVVWGLSSWHTPKPSAPAQLPGESSSDATPAVGGAGEGAGEGEGEGDGVNGDIDSVTGSKANLLSSAVPSEKSNAGDAADVGDVEASSMPPSAAESPVPVATASA